MEDREDKSVQAVSGSTDEPNKKDEEYEKVCYVCRRPESKVGKLISMPGGLDICADCMQKAFDTFQQSGLSYTDLMRMGNMVQPPDSKENGDGDKDKDKQPPVFAGIPFFELGPHMEIPKKQRIKKKKAEGEEPGKK